MSTRSGASSSRLCLRDQSAELEKLLGSSGDGPVLDADLAKARTYNVEMMVDELLSSTWEPAQPSGSSHSPRHIGSPTQTRRASFTQQTTSLNALQAVLTDSIERLVKHRRVISDRIGELEQDNRRVSVKYQEGLARPDLLLNQICEQMEDLEERFTKVSSTAVLIGDKLSTLDDERSRVLETDELMEALLALNDPSSKLTKSSNRLFNTLHDPTQLHEAAQIIKKMSVFSSELLSPTIAYAVAEIERLSQTIENNLLTEFSNEQEKDNLAGMRKCAESLIEYNDKEKVADRYVWNVMCDRLAKAAGDPTVASLDPIEDLDALFTKILTICEEQFPIIDAVFPTAGCDSVRELLVERLFNDPAFGILSYLEQFLNTRRYSGASTPAQRMPDISGLPPTPTSVAQAASNENREYVRLLCAAYEKTCSMVLAIESIERPKQPAPNTSATTSNQVLGNDNPADDEHQTTMTADRERMHTFLSLQLHSLFGSHRQKYFQTELDLLQSHFKDTFGKLKFPQLPAISKHKASSSKAKNAATPAPAVSSTTPSPSVSSTQLVSVSASSISSSNFDKDGINTSLEASLVFYESLKALAEDENVPSEYAEVMIKAVGRCEVILKGSELRGELITKVFSSFAASYGDEYLGVRLSVAKSSPPP
ncbi:hypothetical protein BBJ28_00023647 [Nothophytophthora sp. Chile5]|nr:hypothetical protein BBJ28_00023647 [Nothophytophthora sp. Chile5]